MQSDNFLGKECQRLLLLEYLRRYHVLPDERMLDLIDDDVFGQVIDELKTQ